ncbi:MAG: hypothetical protein AAB947_01685 [Patescibacteria group bacterium]
MKYTKIVPHIVANDLVLLAYLWQAKISAAQRGGTFVGRHGVAPDELKKYGIILPKGGMILPGAEPNEIIFALDLEVEKKIAEFAQKLEIWAGGEHGQELESARKALQSLRVFRDKKVPIEGLLEEYETLFEGQLDFSWSTEVPCHAYALLKGAAAKTTTLAGNPMESVFYGTPSEGLARAVATRQVAKKVHTQCGYRRITGEWGKNNPISLQELSLLELKIVSYYTK